MAKKYAASLDIEGMTCVNCAKNVTRLLEKRGFSDVAVDFTTGEATFASANPISFEEVSAGLSNIGFTARPKDAATPPQGALSSIEKKFLFALLFALPLFAHMFLPHTSVLSNTLVQLGLCIPVMLLGWWHFGKSAIGSLRGGVPNMDVLIVIGSTAAFFYSLWGTAVYYGTPEAHNFLFYETAATIITLVLLGNVLEHRAVRATTTAVRELSALQLLKAKRIVSSADGERIEEIDAQQVRIGNVLQVNEGDHIPVDGRILSGTAALNEAMLTGESLPITRTAGELVAAGTLLASGNVRIEATSVGQETVLAKIIELVKAAQRDKPSIQRLGDKISAIFVPVVVGIAALTFAAWWFFTGDVQQAMLSAVAVLVISCPCAMGLATPTAVAVGIGRAARSGILIKGASTLELLANVRTIIFDKTGTLTTGQFALEELRLFGNAQRADAINALVALELRSSHPLAQSIVAALQQEAAPLQLQDIAEQKGFGISGTDDAGNSWKAGSADFGPVQETQAPANVYLWRNSELVAALRMADTMRPEATEAIKQLQQLGTNTVLLSGDREANCQAVAEKLSLSSCHSEQKPEQKLEVVRNYAKQGFTAMVGDGINDAPALAAATVGISLNGATRAAIDSALVVLLQQNGLRALPEAVLLSRATLTTIKQNLFWAFAYNVVAIPIAAFGLLNPMVAALSMAFSDVMVVGNSLRLRYRKLKRHR